MRTAFICATLVLLSGRLGFAQMSIAPAAPAMGTTSPLGVPGATIGAGPVGTQQGAKALSPGGLGIAPLNPTASTTPCFSAGTSASAVPGTGSRSTLDATDMNLSTTNSAMPLYGMNSGTTVIQGSCGSGSSAGTASTLTSTSSMSGSATGAVSGSGIPLGSAELNNAGVSPMITSPMPTFSAAGRPCTASSSTTTIGGTSGSTTSMMGPSQMGSSSRC